MARNGPLISFRPFPWGSTGSWSHIGHIGESSASQVSVRPPSVSDHVRLTVHHPGWGGVRVQTEIERSRGKWNSI
jgi:hypothetical protein